MKPILYMLLLVACALGLAARGYTKAIAMPPKQKITTCLWFAGQAEEAMRFYMSLFDGSKVLEESRWGKDGPLPEGTLLSARFRIAGQELLVLSGNSSFEPTETTSLMVECADQAEVDRLWERLSASGGEPSMCGWLKDKYGISWQIVPSALLEMLRDQDPARVKRVVDVMLTMQKLDVARLQQAYDGR
jgi:predicted 3-demethylubiquinone-9 3-methyltransferase (glyoxalase superfamily)